MFTHGEGKHTGGVLIWLSKNFISKFFGVSSKVIQEGRILRVSLSEESMATLDIFGCYFSPDSP